MATESQIMAFIDKIAPCAINAYNTLGKVFPSVCIGMACVESAYGTAGSAKYNSYLGQKVGTGKTATKYWSGGFFLSSTKEEYTIGTHTVIKAAFRAYDSMHQCVMNYYELLNTKLYSRVTSGVDYKTQMQQIKTCGYMTSSTEVNSVIKIIEKYGLTKYDAIVSADTKPCSPIEDDPNRNPYEEPTRAIRYNSKGNGVRWCQYALNKKGGYNLKVDGIAGPLTINALRDFQLKNNLAVDGICGENTRAALR